MSKNLEWSQVETVVEAYEEELKGLIAQEMTPIRKQVQLNYVVDKYRSALGFTLRDVEKHLLLLENTAEVAVKTSYSLEDILQARNSSDSYLVPGILKKGGSLYILSGPPKSAKSFWMYDVAAGLVLGTEVFGMPVPASRVLIFQKEEPQATFIKRLRTRGIEAANLSDSIISESPLRVEREFDLATDIPALKRLLTEFKPDLVCFDSFRAITATTGVSENSPEIAKYLYVLQKVLVMHGVTGIVIHHANKGADKTGVKSMSGSQAIAGANDGMIFLNPGPAGKGLTIAMETLPRDGIALRMVLEQRKNREEYTRFAVTEQSHISDDAYRMQRRILRILATKAQEDPDAKLTRADLRRELGANDSDGNTLYLALDFLTDSGQVCYERNKIDDKVATVYWITPSNPWIRFHEVSSNKVFIDAEQLTHIQDGDQIISLVNSWPPDYKTSVWNTLSATEQEEVRRKMYPPFFTEGTWVKLASTGSLEQVETLIFVPETKAWSYTLKGHERKFAQSELLHDENYTNVASEL